MTKHFTLDFTRDKIGCGFNIESIASFAIDRGIVVKEIQVEPVVLFQYLKLSDCKVVYLPSGAYVCGIKIVTNDATPFDASTGIHTSYVIGAEGVVIGSVLSR